MRLIPSLKQKKRYLVFEVQSSEKFALSEIKEEVENSLLLFLGQQGMARAEPIFIQERFNEATQRFVIKTSHKHVDEVKTALALSKKVKKVPVIIRSIITSGTLKKASAYL